ncbi:hypothetical protein [Micromonospora sp. RTGN7]|uniref:hypothetical protein n=1 Tax=Micromonospora sp. RTGN7 TaxID=3016526 RepID=UPI0029FF28B7|nr:hypothetical protein [Micromonospora sp. RTGN7]
MHVFPAQIPAAEARRVDVVEFRVARKVAPLFGVSGGIDPFRRSWVCDYTALSLAEIGRGAPHPSRAERSELEAASPAGRPDGVGADWVWAGRGVWSRQQAALPGALSNATLNRYGPDTKAAVVLAGANRLLLGATDAVAAAARRLALVDCDPEVRLAVWAGLVLEVYRAQPALVVAAVQARQVQRSLSARWGEQVDRGRVKGVDAPSEIHPAGVDGPDGETVDGRWRPTSFDLVDSTLPALGLADDTADGPGLVTADALDDIASAWCHRLLGIGRPGRGVVWLTEDDDGSRRAEAMVRVGAVVAPFVAATLGGTTAGERTSPPPLPPVPQAGELVDVAVLRRRAHLLGTHVAANYVRYRDEWLLEWPELRARTRELVGGTVDRCAETLDDDDPVALLLRGYAAYLEVWDHTRVVRRSPAAGGDREPDGPVAAVQRLTASQQQVVASWRAGRLDPGAAAYLLEIGNVALLDATADPDDGVTPGSGPHPTPTAMRSWWSAILEARGIAADADLAASLDSLGDAQVFHLHHYAAWRAGSGRRGDLRQALAVQERVASIRTQVARRETAGFVAKSAAARAGHELAAQIATDLALATPERERGPRAEAARTALRHARTVLADPSTRLLLEQAGGAAATVRTVRVVVRALLLAASHGVDVAAEDAAAALALLDGATADDSGTPSGGTSGAASGGASGAACRLDETSRATPHGWRAELAALAGRTPPPND